MLNTNTTTSAAPQQRVQCIIFVGLSFRWGSYDMGRKPIQQRRSLCSRAVYAQVSGLLKTSLGFEPGARGTPR